MKINHNRNTMLVFVLLICLVIPLRSANAAEGGSLPAFPGFVVAVADGQPKVVRGVYVPDTLALRVMQQSVDEPESVYEINGVATQFSPAARNHVIGLLAHNTLAGAAFSNLMIGQEVRMVYGDSRVEYYRVNRLARFQALQPGSQNEKYVDLSSDIAYTAQAIFTMFYEGGAHVTFQTCILQDGNPSWGRLFVTAIPVPSTYLWEVQAFRFRISLDIAATGMALKALISNLSYP